MNTNTKVIGFLFPATKKRGEKQEEIEYTTRDTRLRLKPTPVQDTDYMVEITYHLTPYWALLGPI